MQTVQNLGELVVLTRKILTKWELSEASADIWFRGVDKQSLFLTPQVYRDKGFHRLFVARFVMREHVSIEIIGSTTEVYDSRAKPLILDRFDE